MVKGIDQGERSAAQAKMALVKSAFDSLAEEMNSLGDEDRTARTAALAKLLNEVVLCFRLSVQTALLDGRFRSSDSIVDRNAAEAEFFAGCRRARAMYAQVNPT